MGSLLEIGLANAVVAGTLALLALLVGRCSRRPAMVHVLWLLVLIKLVTPPVIGLPIPWWQEKSQPVPATEPVSPGEMPAREVAQVPPMAVSPVPALPAFTRLEDLMAEKIGAPAPAALAAAAPMAPGMIPGMPAVGVPTVKRSAPVVEASGGASGEGRAEASAGEEKSDEEAERWKGVVELVGVVWLSGAVGWLMLAGWRVYRFQRLLRHAKRSPASLQEEVDVLAQQLGLRRSPKVWLVPGPVPPLLWAFAGRAALYFPEKLLPRLDTSERATLLAHELAHLARRDHWVRLLELLVSALYWWYPLVWLACRRLQAAEEECCDAWVVHGMPGFNAAYAGALLETVDFLAEQPATLPPVASGFGRVHHLKKRLAVIVRGAPPRGLSLLGKLVVVLLLLALPLTPVKARPEAEPSEERSETPAAQVSPSVPKAAGVAERKEVELPEEPDRFQNNPRTLLSQTGGQVWATAISPDGKLLAVVSGSSGNDEGALTLYELASGKERVSHTESKPIRSVRFTPDGKYLVTGDFANKIQLRDGQTGEVRHELLGHTGAVNAVACTGDGKLLVSGSLDKTIKVWDLQSRKLLRTLPGHTDWVLQVAVSADGKTILSVSKDGTGRTWDLADGKLRQVLKGHNGWVEGCAISADGKLLVTTGHDNTVKVWDGESGKHLRDLAGHTGVVNTAVFLADGKTLATCSHDYTVRLWEVASGRLEFTLETQHGERIHGLAVSGDGKTLVTGSWDRTTKVWDMESKEVKYTLTPKIYQPENLYPVLTVAASRDGQMLAVAGEERAIKLVEASTGRVIRLLEGHEDIVAKVTFSPEGKRLASASFDGTIKLWEVGTGKCVRTLKGHVNWVFTVVFSPDGEQLVSGGYDRTVRLWEVQTGKLLVTLEKHRGGVRAVAFSPDGKQVASGGTDKAVRIWNVASREVMQTLKGHEDAVREVAYSADGGRIASGSEDGSVRLWEVQTGKQLAIHQGPGGSGDMVLALKYSPQGQRLAVVYASRRVELLNVNNLASTWTGTSNFADETTSVAFGPDARVLYVGSRDRSLRAWQGQVAPRQPIVTFPGTGKQFWFASYSPDGRWLAMGGEDRILQVRAARFGRLQGVLEEAPAAVFGMAVSPDGTMLATSCFDKAVRLYELKTRRLVRTLSGLKERVWTVAYSPDGKRLAVAAGSFANDYEGEVKVFEVASGKEVLALEGIDASAMAVAWSPDGKWLGVGTRDGLTRIYEAATGKVKQTMKGHREMVRIVCFAPDGRHLASAGAEDATVRIWKVETGTEVAKLEGHKTGVNCVDWSRDGKMLAASSRPRPTAEPGEVRIWNVEEKEGQLKFSEKAKLLGHKANVLCCAFSPDGKMLASGGGVYSSYGETIVWDVATGKPMAMLHGHPRWVEGVIFTKDSKTLITGGGTQDSPGEVRFWDVEHAGGWTVEKAHAGQICCAAWSPDSKTLATGSYDRTIKLWNAESGKVQATLKEAHKKHLRSLMFSPDGKTLASSSDDETVKLWDLGNQSLIAEIARHEMQVTSVAFSPDGKLLATASGHTQSGNPAGAVRVFEVETGRERKEAEWSGKGAVSVAFSPDGKHLVTGGVGANALRIYDVASGKLVKQVQGANSIRVVTFSPGGELLATAHGPESSYGNGSVQVWETKTWTERTSMTGHGSLVLGMSFSKDNRYLATASNDKTVKVWDLLGGKRSPVAMGSKR